MSQKIGKSLSKSKPGRISKTFPFPGVKAKCCLLLSGDAIKLINSGIGKSNTGF